MKRLIGLVLAVAVVFAVSLDAGSAGLQGIKVGGGVLFNGKASPAAAPGVHVSADVTLGHFRLTPFYEFSRRNGVNTTLFGQEITFAIPIRHGWTGYLGKGFGGANVAGSTKFLVNVVSGIEVNASKWMGVFVQGKYAWASDMVNGMTAHAGLTISFGGPGGHTPPGGGHR